MARTFVFGLAVALAGLWTSTGTAAPVPVRAADAPLAIVPASAPIVVHVKGIDRTVGRLNATMTAAVPEFAPLATVSIERTLGEFFTDRKKDSLAANGPIFLAVLEMPNPQAGAPPAMALIFRTTSYAAFRGSFLTEDERKSIKAAGDGIEQCELKGKEFFLVDKGDFVVAATNKESAELLAKQYMGLDGKMPKEMATKLLDYDVGVFVNLGAVSKEFGDQIRAGREQMMQLLDMAAGAGGGPGKEQMAAAKKIYAAMFQVVLDGRAFVGGVDFRPEGLAMHFQAQVGAETDTGVLLKNQKPAGLDQIGKLPTGLMMYSGMDMTPDTMKALMSMSQGLTAGEGDAKKAVEAALEQLAAANGKTMYSSMSYPPGGVTFQEFADPAKAVAATIAMYKAFGDGSGYMGAMLKSKPEIKTNEVELQGIKFNHATLVFDIDKMLESIPGGVGGDGMKEGFKKIMGDGMNVWFGSDGKRMITVMAKNWAEAQKKLETFLAGKALVGELPAFQSTRKQLPAAASVVYLMDSGPFSNWMADYMVTIFKAMPGLPINLPDSVKPTDTTPAFIGMSLVLQPERGAIDLYVPVTAVQEIKKVIVQLFQGGN